MTSNRVDGDDLLCTAFALAWIRVEFQEQTTDEQVGNASIFWKVIDGWQSDDTPSQTLAHTSYLQLLIFNE